jgi:hypothetical protein
MGFTVSSVISSARVRLLDRIGIGLVSFWTALGRSTLDPVGPQRVPDQHPTCVGHARPGERDPSL